MNRIMTLGENLRFFRKESGFSLKRVEELTGVDNGNLSRYERDLNIPNIELCIKLAELYRISLDELVGRDTTLQSPISTPASPHSDEERELLAVFSRMNHAQRVRFVAYGEGILGSPVSIPTRK